MQLLEVTHDTPALQKKFLRLPVKIYKGDTHWIRPLDKDIENIFNPSENPSYQHGACIRWILETDEGECVGRVAAFYDTRTKDAGNQQPTGGMGFFECVNDQTYAHLLLDACQQWLSKKGLQAMDGPINFGSRDRWWGLLVDGFDPPNCWVPYNPPYYKQLLENYGFQDYFQQYTYRRFMNGPALSEKFYEKYNRIKQNTAYHFEHINKKNIIKYASDFREIYNASWVKHTGVSEMTEEDTQDLLKKMKPVIDEKLIWFVYYNQQPIAFMVMIPELNQLFRYANGKLDWWAKAKIAYHLWRGAGKKILGLIIGVMPRFHGRGLESAMIAEFSKVAYDKKFKYTELEFNWVGDFLPAMMHVYESLEAKVVKTHITYRKLFDSEKPFTRHPPIK